jgi:transposase
MRGRFFDQGGMFSYTRPEQRVPANHPLRKVRELVGEVLGELNHTFGKLYSHEGRPSLPPEQLLSALLLQAFYSIRSERQLMEQLNYNLLFRWFVGLLRSNLLSSLDLSDTPSFRSVPMIIFAISRSEPCVNP